MFLESSTMVTTDNLLALNTVFEDGFHFLPRISTEKLIEPPLNVGPSFGKW